MLPLAPPMYLQESCFHILNDNQMYPLLGCMGTIVICPPMNPPHLPNMSFQIASHVSQDFPPPCTLPIPYFSKADSPSL
jgi:hypothetical protein